MASGIVATVKFLLTFGAASVLVLVFSLIFNPMFAIMAEGVVRDILMLVFPKILLIFIFFIAVAKYYLDIQGGGVIRPDK